MAAKKSNFNKVSLEWMRDVKGCEFTHVLETYNPFAKKKKDLWGFADYIGMNDEKTILVQATSRSNIRSREKKVLASKAAETWVQSRDRSIYVLGWDKVKDKYRVRVIEVSASSFGSKENGSREDA